MSAAKRGGADDPLEDAELKELFSEIEIRALRAIVIAVSGGPDSMALMAMAARWRAAGKSDIRILVATVDHGLRPEAQAECAMVAGEAARLGMECRILRWEGDKPATGIQEKAREARYKLLFDLCRAEEACLFTAHTLDDLAETVMMRLSRGSGISGLTGISRARSAGNILHLRPLIGLAKARLIASCRAWNIPFVEDPSNRCEDFTRVRWRKLMPVLAREGLDARRIAIFAGRLARADKALAGRAALAAAACRIDGAPDGAVRLDGRALYGNEASEIALRVFADAVGSESHLRLNRLEECVRAFRKAVLAAAPLRRTLAGTMISLDGKGILTFTPEPPRKRGRQKSIC